MNSIAKSRYSGTLRSKGLYSLFGRFWCSTQGFCFREWKLPYALYNRSKITVPIYLTRTLHWASPKANIREQNISPKFFRLKFFHGRPRGMSMQIFFSGTWRASPKFLAGSPQGCPAQNFLFGLIFRSGNLTLRQRIISTN